MSGRRRFICPNGFHRAMRLCFRGFDATKLMTSGASPIAQMSGAVVEGPSFAAATNIHAGGDGRGALLARPKRFARQPSPKFLQGNQRACKLVIWTVGRNIGRYVGRFL